MRLENINHAVKITRVAGETVKAEENNTVKRFGFLDIFQDRLYARAVEILPGIAIVVNHAIIAKTR
ncbi:MAG TPA: hypothetical protein P5110_08405 [Candidatus Omnitrophota bacterium]|nr:hypothetical protein [Candidatus Omnitrophota bacterium]HRZ15510.1 hypothetical protein [Candidatus Omnitrophota bacterium]